MVEKNIEVFISYADADQALLEDLEKRLRRQPITIWHKYKIQGGADLAERDEQLNSSQLILLLVTPDFINDDDCHHEMVRALARREAKEARVIPIILRPTILRNTPLAEIQVLPRNAHHSQAKTERQPDKDEIFMEIEEGIDEVLNDMLKAARWQRPDGWEHITPEYLESQKHPYDQEKLVKFFDGRLPDWDVAQFPQNQLPQRDIVGTLEKELELARQEGRIRVILLEGAAGEGKSTALRQTVCNLVHPHSGWRVWWATKVDSYLRLPLDTDNLPISSSETLLIVADDASPIAGEICKSVQSLRAAYKQHVVFLLSSQRLAWQEALIAHPEWAKYVKDIQSSFQLAGIVRQEAQSIVAAWAACGDKGLGKLKDISPNSRWLSFYKQAKPDSGQERSFLGAALTARYTRKDLEKRILALLDRLSTKEAQGDIIPNGKTLAKALAFICTVDYINSTRKFDDLHLVEDLKLTTDIFAQLFGCKPEQVYEKFVIPLGEEAAANSAGNILYSRHQAIAKVVVQHIRSLGITFFDICGELIRAVCRLYSQGRLYNRDMTPWNRLPSWFFNTELHWLPQDDREELGILLVKEFIQSEPKNPIFYVDLSTFYRKKNDPEASVAWLRGHFDQVDVDRKYYYEWATAEGHVGNKKRNTMYYRRDIWLSGVSLADVIHKKYTATKPASYYKKDDPVDVDRASLSLAGLAAALSNFLDEEGIFLHACASCVRLGLLLNPNREVPQSEKDKTSKSLHGNKSKCEKKGIVFPHQKPSKDDCSKELLNIQKGITAAYLQCKDELPPDVPKGDKLTFNKLTQRVFEYCVKA